MGKEETMRAAIYIRVSTLDQAREGYSLEAQEAALRKWAADKRWDIVEVYADRGISGKDIIHRPDLRRLIKDAEQKKFDIVMFWALSRFTRSVADLYKTMEKFQRWGISMASYTEAFDTSTPMGRAMIGVVGIFAQLERELTSERIRAAMEVWIKKGNCTMSRMLGYDRVDGEITINKKEAEQVMFIYDQYIKRKSITEVTQLCRDRGYRGKDGGIPKPESIHKILTRIRYCGYNTFHGEICPGRIPAIIPEDKFRRAQRILAQQGKIVGRKRIHELPQIPKSK